MILFWNPGIVIGISDSKTDFQDTKWDWDPEDQGQTSACLHTPPALGSSRPAPTNLLGSICSTLPVLPCGLPLPKMGKAGSGYIDTMGIRVVMPPVRKGRFRDRCGNRL